MAPLPVGAGVRKEVRAEGKTVLLFWYRNQIYAIEARWVLWVRENDLVA